MDCGLSTALKLRPSLPSLAGLPVGWTRPWELPAQAADWMIAVCEPQVGGLAGAWPWGAVSLGGATMGVGKEF